MILRLLVFAGLVLVLLSAALRAVALLVRGAALRGEQRRHHPRSRGGGGHAVELVRCDHCGVYLPGDQVRAHGQELWCAPCSARGQRQTASSG